MVISGENLSVQDVFEIAVNGEPVELEPERLKVVSETWRRVQAWGAERIPLYGVNTGFGELIHYLVSPACKTELQLNLVRSHAAAWGEPFPDEVTRAIMTARLNCFMKGHSGVSEETVGLFREFLNRGITPVVPQHGSLGASGDLGPLAHMALTFIGDGHVSMNGRICPSGGALAEQGLKPLDLGFKEALALINGTSAMTGLACLNAVRAATLLKLAVLASAYVIQCLRGSTRAFDAKGHQLKNHSGQIAVAGALASLLSGSGLTREQAGIMKAIALKMNEKENDVVDTGIYLQAAYSLRCVPQILGAVLDTLKFCRQIVEEEVNSCNDNPLFMDTPEGTFHGGNFHGQYVAMASDFMAVAVAEIGVLAERQLNRLIDPHLNGQLPACLADGASGLHCGFEGGQYLATSLAAENLDLAAPTSLKSIPSNGSNQDVVSMGLTSARRVSHICDHVLTMLATLVGACHQATYFVGRDQFSRPASELHEMLTVDVPIYQDSIPLADVIGHIRAFLASDVAADFVERNVDLGASLRARAWSGRPVGAETAVA